MTRSRTRGTGSCSRLSANFSRSRDSSLFSPQAQGFLATPSLTQHAKPFIRSSVSFVTFCQNTT